MNMVLFVSCTYMINAHSITDIKLHAPAWHIFMEQVWRLAAKEPQTQVTSLAFSSLLQCEGCQWNGWPKSVTIKEDLCKCHSTSYSSIKSERGVKHKFFIIAGYINLSVTDLGI